MELKGGGGRRRGERRGGRRRGEDCFDSGEDVGGGEEAEEFKGVEVVGGEGCEGKG